MEDFPVHNAQYYWTCIVGFRVIFKYDSADSILQSYGKGIFRQDALALLRLMNFIECL